jgi:hypothetical protein
MLSHALDTSSFSLQTPMQCVAAIAVHGPGILELTWLYVTITSSQPEGPVCCLQVSKASTCWKVYVDYVSDIVIEGFGSAITASTHYLLQQLDAEALAR